MQATRRTCRQVQDDANVCRSTPQLSLSMLACSHMACLSGYLLACISVMQHALSDANLGALIMDALEEADEAGQVSQGLCWLMPTAISKRRTFA